MRRGAKSLLGYSKTREITINKNPVTTNCITGGISGEIPI